MPKSYDFTLFVQKCRHCFIQTVFFFSNYLLHGHEDFSDQFRKNIMGYKRIGYNLNVMQQSACLVINPITVDGYGALFKIARRWIGRQIP